MVHNQREEEGKDNTQESTANPDHVLDTLWNKVQEAGPLRARHLPSVAEWGGGGTTESPRKGYRCCGNPRKLTGLWAAALRQPLKETVCTVTPSSAALKSSRGSKVLFIGPSQNRKCVTLGNKP